MNEAPSGGPVFLLSAHRSGGTLLARALNCHPDLVIWGEHAGFINRLADIDSIAGHYPRLTEPLADRDLATFVAHEKSDPRVFDPWVTPFAQDGFRDWCRRYIETTFRHGLRPGQRWGFKEVRYHTVAVAGFLATLFPTARFVILRRELYPLALSNLFAPWSVDRLRWTGALLTEAGVRAAVTDCAYALVAIDHGFAAIAAALPDRCHVVAYEAITPAATRLFAELFLFLGLRGSPELLQAIRAVVGARPGASDARASEGHLTLRLVQRHLPEALAAALADIAKNGPDAARLKRLAPQGRFGFLAGDHHLYETPYSGMF